MRHLIGSRNLEQSPGWVTGTACSKCSDRAWSQRKFLLILTKNMFLSLWCCRVWHQRAVSTSSSAEEGNIPLCSPQLRAWHVDLQAGFCDIAANFTTFMLQNLGKVIQLLFTNVSAGTLGGKNPQALSKTLYCFLASPSGCVCFLAVHFQHPYLVFSVHLNYVSVLQIISTKELLTLMWETPGKSINVNALKNTNWTFWYLFFLESESVFKVRKVSLLYV